MAACEYDRIRQALPELQTPVWPADRLAKIVDGHEAELFFSEIARRIGGGVTKNAVISQAHRIGLPLRDRNAGYIRLCASRPKRAATPRPPKAPPKPPKRRLRALPADVEAALALPGLSPVLISALSPHQCRWPVGDPKDPDFAFCGRLKAADDGPYCRAHQAAAINPDATRKARRENLERMADRQKTEAPRCA